MTVIPKRVIMFYSNRDTMEKLIKETKNGIAFDSRSITKYIAKINLLLLACSFDN